MVFKAIVVMCGWPNWPHLAQVESGGVWLQPHLAQVESGGVWLQPQPGPGSVWPPAHTLGSTSMLASTCTICAISFYFTIKLAEAMLQLLDRKVKAVLLFA